MSFNIPAYLMAKNGNVPVGAEPFDIPAYLMAKAASGGGIKEISGTLPLAVRSRASQVLKNYIIYGTASGAGVRTENDFPFANKGTFAFGDDGNIISDGKGKFVVSTPSTIPANTQSELIPLNRPYTIPQSVDTGGEFIFYIGNNDSRQLYLDFYDAEGVKIEFWLCSPVQRKVSTYTQMTGKTIAYIGFHTTSLAINAMQLTPMFSKNDNLTSYIPHGYKLPITVTSNGTTTDYPVYIGDSQLMAEEYVDYEEQKVYKRTEIKGLSEPLYGIGNYKDTLDLSTGVLTRRVKKLVLTGEEGWILSTTWKHTATSVFYVALDDIIRVENIISVFVCSNAFDAASRNKLYDGDSDMVARTGNNALTIRISDGIATTVTDFKSYLTAQYSVGTPITVWYVLDTPTTETITVPSGLTGTIEGYLVQDETPTPTNPIYPTSNGTKQQDNTYSVYTEYNTPTDPPVPLPDISLPQGEVAIDIEGELKPQAAIEGKIVQI